MAFLVNFHVLITKYVYDRHFGPTGKRGNPLSILCPVTPFYQLRLVSVSQFQGEVSAYAAELPSILLGCYGGRYKPR